MTNMKPVFDRFYAQAETLVTEAQPLDADAKQRKETITLAEEQDAQDRAALADLERRVHALTTQIAGRAEQLATARKELEDVEGKRDALTAEAEAIVAIVEREKARIAAELAPLAPVLPPGVVPADPLNGSPLVTRRDPLPVEQDGSQPS